jgi:hypothetical protein
MKAATISSDIIAYTSLSQQNKRALEQGIRDLLSHLSLAYAKQGFYGRLVKGDYIECALLQPQHALRLALILKTYVKAFAIAPQKGNSNFKIFQNYGIRTALAIDTLEVLDAQKGIIDGEAIYNSGRLLQNLTTSHKQKISIKNTLFFYHAQPDIRETFSLILALLNEILNKNSAKQSEVIFYKLQGKSEKEITEILSKSQSTISQHSTAGGWLSIEQAINYFEKNIS